MIDRVEPASGTRDDADGTFMDVLKPPARQALTSAAYPSRRPRGMKWPGADDDR
jgi:hypothetical protein